MDLPFAESLEGENVKLARQQAILYFRDVCSSEECIVNPFEIAAVHEGKAGDMFECKFFHYQTWAAVGILLGFVYKKKSDPERYAVIIFSDKTTLEYVNLGSRVQENYDIYLNGVKRGSVYPVDPELVQFGIFYGVKKKHWRCEWDGNRICEVFYRTDNALKNNRHAEIRLTDGTTFYISFYNLTSWTLFVDQWRYLFSFGRRKWDLTDRVFDDPSCLALNEDQLWHCWCFAILLRCVAYQIGWDS